MEHPRGEIVRALLMGVLILVGLLAATAWSVWLEGP